MSNENQTLPTSLEDAMRMVRETDEQNSTEAVGGGSMEQGSNMESGAPTGEQGGNTGNQSGEVSNKSTTQNQLWSGVNEANGQSQENSFTDGGSTASSMGSSQASGAVNPSRGLTFDYAQMSRQYVEDASRKAVEATNELFRNNGISKFSLDDLYQRDESGRVLFENPDEPDRPFTSRAEAKEWINAFNEEIDEAWNKYAREYQYSFMKDIEPAMEMFQFGPEYEKMSKAEQDIFDEITNPYIITDEDGTSIGYSCDLNKMKNVAVNICAKMNQSNLQGQGGAQNQQATTSGPALDATTSGSNSAQGNSSEEPKNIQDAMRIINSQKKQQK